MKPDSSPDPDLEAELRQSAGRDLAEEAAEDERLTEKLRDRRSGLRQRLLDLGATSRLVRVDVGSRTFTGAVACIGTDFAEIDRGDDLTAIRFEVGVWTAEVRTTPRRPSTKANISLKGHLAGLESTSETVQLVTIGGPELGGVVLTVATDHIVLKSGDSDTLVPLAAILAVIRVSRP